MPEVEKVLLDAIKEMDGGVGFDAVIVCTSNLAQEQFWQKRLTASRGRTAREGAIILAVHEDWDAGGAGNGLGTLYAYVKARAKAQAEFDVDLDKEIKGGWSVAMYHTAGKGTRLAPLPGSENNNKPGVKLPSILQVDGEDTELTILEAVIRQTNSYAPQRKGRCSVFWGDQVFIPSAGTMPSGSHPADILALLGPMPTEAQWAERGLEKYGLIAVNSKGHAAQVEKVSYKTAVELLKGFGEIKEVGPSLGSFSLGADMLVALLEEFAPELEAKKIKLDSDPHFWMPMTLPAAEYTSIMQTKGMTEAEAGAHYARMQSFKERFSQASGFAEMLGCVNAGDKCYWWDYGLLKLYAKNNLLATADSVEGHALRTFLQITERNTLREDCAVKADKESVVLASELGGGEVTGSVLSTVVSQEVHVVNSVLVNVTAKKIKCKNCVLYNVVDHSEEGLDLPDGAVRADVFIPGAEPIVLRSSLDTDGGVVWKVKLDLNTMSFEDVHKANSAVDIVEAQAVARVAKRKRE